MTRIGLQRQPAAGAEKELGDCHNVAVSVPAELTWYLYGRVLSLPHLIIFHLSHPWDFLKQIDTGSYNF